MKTTSQPTSSVNESPQRRKRPFSVAFFVLAVVVAVLPGFPRIEAGSHPSDPVVSPKAANVGQRIERIENGLTPGITIKGEPVRKMKLAERMKFYDVPGVSIAFFEHGEILWTKTYGYANVAEHKLVTLETLFQAGSISKPTTGLAALHLVEEGKLGLDEDVNARLKEWKIPENEFTREQKVTLRRLLSHTAGMNVHGFEGYKPGDPVPTLLEVLNGEPPTNTPPIRVILVPGTTWRYSGGGYTVVQLLLTESEHEPFPQLMADLVLRPAGMTHSTFEEPLPADRKPMAATPYRGDGIPVEGGAHTYPEMAAAGLWTTPSDLAHMAIEVQKEYEGQSERILSSKTARLMLSREKDRWGLGFAIEEPAHRMRFGHGGSDEGFESRLEAYTESGQGIAIMTNGARGDQLIREVMCAVSQEYGWPDFKPHEHALVKVNPSVLRTYAGRYKLPDGQTLVVKIQDGRAYIEGIAPEPQQMFPESPTQFFLLSDQIIFRFPAESPVTSMTVLDGGDVLTATRIPD